MGTSWGIPRGEKWFNNEGVVSTLCSEHRPSYYYVRRYEVKYVAPGTLVFTKKKHAAEKKTVLTTTVLLHYYSLNTGGVFDDKIRKIHQFVVVCTWCVTPVCSYFTKKIICRHQKYIFCCICLHRSGLWRYRRPPELEKLGPIPGPSSKAYYNRAKWSAVKWSS